MKVGERWFKATLRPSARQVERFKGYEEQDIRYEVFRCYRQTPKGAWFGPLSPWGYAELKQHHSDKLFWVPAGTRRIQPTRHAALLALLGTAP